MARWIKICRLMVQRKSRWLWKIHSSRWRCIRRWVAWGQSSWLWYILLRRRC